MSPQPITENTLFYGDNLTILREYIPDESIDLTYLDPPFNSSRSYNVLFKDESGIDSEAQIGARTTHAYSYSLSLSYCMEMRYRCRHSSARLSKHKERKETRESSQNLRCSRKKRQFGGI